MGTSFRMYTANAINRPPSGDFSALPPVEHVADREAKVTGNDCTRHKNSLFSAIDLTS
jgi:hypothetical protein